MKRYYMKKVPLPEYPNRMLLQGIEISDKGYAEDQVLAGGYERITRKAAEKLCGKTSRLFDERQITAVELMED